MDVNGAVERDVHRANPSISILVRGCAYVKVGLSVMMMAGLMKMEAGRAASDRLGLGKGWDSKGGQKQEGDECGMDCSISHGIPS